MKVQPLPCAQIQRINLYLCRMIFKIHDSHNHTKTKKTLVDFSGVNGGIGNMTCFRILGFHKIISFQDKHNKPFELPTIRTCPDWNLEGKISSKEDWRSNVQFSASLINVQCMCNAVRRVCFLLCLKMNSKLVNWWIQHLASSSDRVLAPSEAVFFVDNR